MVENKSVLNFTIDQRVWPGVFLLAALGVLGCIFISVPAAFLSVLFFMALHVTFFRDPVRHTESKGVLAPADGKVVEVSLCDEPRYIHGQAIKIGIFLSILDVHVNRMPWTGTIEWLEHVPGRFLNAMKQEASTVNECVWLGCRDGERKFVVRPISGLIARHIHWDIKKGQTLARGAKIGIICYGSRTEIYLPAAEFETLVHVGDVVKLSLTEIGRWK